MNKVILVGRIERENRKDKVTYCTILCRSKESYEYITIAIFNNEFYNKYFRIGKWICIEGYIHINKYNDSYSTEIIAEKLSFVNDATETDKAISDYYKKGGQEIAEM